MQLQEFLKKRPVLAAVFLLPVLAALIFWVKLTPERLLPQSEREATVRFFLDRKQYDRAGELLLKYRRCGVASLAGERFLIALLLKDARQNEAVYWYREFSSAVK